MKLKNKNLIKALIALIVMLLSICALRVLVTIPNNVCIKVNEIKYGFNGKIIKKYSVRNTEPTHLKVLIKNDSIITISPNQDIVDNAVVGDSLYKPANENYIFLKSNGNLKKFFYTKLSYETRKNQKFPVEWRNKWIDSSIWDKSKNND